MTPEEWVRQNIVSYLIEHKKVGVGLISIEKATNYNGLKKRFDLKVYNNAMQLILLVECKAPNIKLTEETLLQSLTYAQSEKPLYIMLSNGLQHIYYDVENKLFSKELEISGI